MTQWIKATQLAALPATGMKRIELDGQPIVIARVGGQLYAFEADCPHAGAPLEQGAICDARVVCPWHKSVFAIDNGALIEPPALSALRTWRVKVDGDDVLIEKQPDAPPSDSSPADAPSARRSSRRFAIIGGGAAGAAAVATLLDEGFDGELTMFAAEPQAPYDRTCLSKFVPAGEMPPNEVPGLLSDAMLRDARLQIEHTAVTHLDAALKRVTLADGRELSFDAMLVASGSTPNRPKLPGSELRGIFTLRDVADAAAILDALAPGDHAVLIGDSFISLETASALRKRNVRVTVLSRTGTPLAGALGSRVGQLFREWHEAHGVVFRRASMVRFEGASGAGVDIDGHVVRVHLNDGSTLDAHAVVAGVGVRPATGFVHGVKLDADGGVSVDASMLAAPSLYCAGDIVRFALMDGAGVTQRVRIEHWRVAQQQARVAARNMLGRHARYEGVPYFWTEHFDKRFEYLGHAAQWDDIALSGRPADEHFSAVWTRFGRVQAVLACGYEQETAQLIEHMRKPLDIGAALAVLGI